jgi:hypothetical protein
LKIILDLLPITSSLGKVPRHRGGGPSDPLVSGLERDARALGSGDPRSGRTHVDGSKTRAVAEAAFKDLRVVGVYPIFDSVVLESRRRCWFLI